MPIGPSEDGIGSELERVNSDPMSPDSQIVDHIDSITMRFNKGPHYSEVTLTAKDIGGMQVALQYVTRDETGVKIPGTFRMMVTDIDTLRKHERRNYRMEW